MTPSQRRILVLSALGLLVAALLAWSFWPRAVAVDIAKVGRGPMRVEVSDEGRTRVRDIYQISAPVTGRLLRVKVHSGDKVQGGKTKLADLLPIAPSFLDARTRMQAESAVKSAEAARNAAAAELNRARSELAFAASELKRMKALAEPGYISKANLDRAQLAHRSALALVATAQASLRVKDSELESARAQLVDPAGTGGNHQAGLPIVAPVSGRVLRVLRESETVMTAGTVILEIGDPDKLEIVAELVSEDAVKIRVGDSARITDWGGPTALNARVRRVEPAGFTKISALGVEEQRVNVLLDFVDPPARWAKMADGYRVIAHITVWQADNILRVPLSAMFRHGKDWAVFLVRGGRARLTPIAVGQANDEMAEVRSGLSPGDTVVLHPSDRVSDGTRITPRGS